LGGKLERVEVPKVGNQAKEPDFIFADGPNAGKKVDFLWSIDANNPKAVEGLNGYFQKHAAQNQFQLMEHLKKAVIVPLDYRNLTSVNQELVNSWIKALTPEQQSKIIILR
jgi:filamentous hemagglutinin